MGPLRHKSVVILSILFILSAFFPQALHAETLKPPFRLLWEKSGSGMMICNGKLIISAKNGYELVSLKTGEAYLTRHIDRDRTIECCEIDGHAAVLMTMKSSLLAYDLDAGKEIWRIGLSYEKYHNFLSHRDGSLLYIQLKNGVISALDMRDGTVLWEYDFLPGTDLFSNDRKYLLSSIAVHGDSLLVSRFLEHRLIVTALDRQSGKYLWQSPQLPGYRFVTTGDRAILIGEKELSAYDMPAWEKLWTFLIDYNAENEMCIWGDRIIVGLTDGYLYALDKNGALQWKAPVAGAHDPEARMGNPILMNDQLLIKSMEDLISISPEGKELWRFDTGERDIHYVTALESPEKYILIGGEHILACFSSGGPAPHPLSGKERRARARQLATRLDSLTEREKKELTGLQREAFPFLFKMVRERALADDAKKDTPENDYLKNSVVTREKQMKSSSGRYRRAELWAIFKRVVTPEDTTMLLSLYNELKTEKAKAPILGIITERCDGPEAATFFIDILKRNHSVGADGRGLDSITGEARGFILRSDDPQSASFLMDVLKDANLSSDKQRIEYFNLPLSELQRITCFRLPFIGGEKGCEMALKLRNSKTRTIPPINEIVDMNRIDRQIRATGFYKDFEKMPSHIGASIDTQPIQTECEQYGDKEYLKECGFSLRLIALRKTNRGITEALINCDISGLNDDIWVLRFGPGRAPEMYFTGDSGKGILRSDRIVSLFETKGLTEDSDGDGWTDILERRFGTDPDKPDTDCDGLIDSRDRNPLAHPRPIGDKEKIIRVALDFLCEMQIDRTVPCLIDMPEDLTPFEIDVWPFVTVLKKKGEIPFDTFTDETMPAGSAKIYLTVPNYDFAGKQVPRSRNQWIIWNDDHTEAKLHIGNWYGPADGEGFDIHLKKIGDEWFIYRWHQVWIS